MSSGLFKNVTFKIFVYKSYIFNINVYAGFGIKQPIRVEYTMKYNQPMWQKHLALLGLVVQKNFDPE